MKGKQLIVQTGLFFLFLCFTIAANGPVQAGNCVKGAFGHENPADFYCVELGYDLESVTDKAGGQHSICKFQDGTYCDAWEFFQGKCGAEYSFCAQRGYGQITKSDGKDPFSRQYAVCISKPSPEVMSATEGRTTQEVGSVTDLMGLRERFSRGPIPEIKVIEAEPQDFDFAPKVLGVPPSSFDWRNYTGEDWMTPVKNQSSCGSCWAFSAVGAVEAAYNIFSGYADLNLNLSEEFLNSDCSSPNPGSCCGGGHDGALNIIRDDGIPDEDCMAYDVPYYSTGDCSCFPNPPCNAACNGLPASCSNLDCTGVCADWTSRLVSIDAYHNVPNDIAQIKQKLVDEGPLSVCLAMSGTYDAQGVYRCSISCWDRNGNGTCETTGTCTAGTCTSGIIGQDCTDDKHCDEDKNDDTICDQNDCGVNHCVVIAGYDDSGGFWITKNSWGNTWDGDGYWNVGFGECHIEKYVRYVDPADIDFPPIADASGPYNVECGGTTTTVQLDGSASIDPEGDSLLYNWTTTCPGGTFNNATIESPMLTIDSSPGCVIECNVSLTVTDGIGQTDETDALISVSDTLTPTIVCPDNKIIECDKSTDPGNTGTATASDTCDPSPVISYDDSVVPGACPAESVITRTWTATDDCGNAASCAQTINEVDTIAPVVSCNTPATIAPPDAPISFTASAVDNCDTSPYVEILDYRCFMTTKKGKIIDKGKSCMVALSGDTVTINDSGGVGDNIRWTTQATDCSGNVTVQECGVQVVNPND